MPRHTRSSASEESSSDYENMKASDAKRKGVFSERQRQRAKEGKQETNPHCHSQAHQNTPSISPGHQSILRPSPPGGHRPQDDWHDRGLHQPNRQQAHPDRLESEIEIRRDQTADGARVCEECGKSTKYHVKVTLDQLPPSLVLALRVVQCSRQLHLAPGRRIHPLA